VGVDMRHPVNVLRCGRSAGQVALRAGQVARATLSERKVAFRAIVHLLPPFATCCRSFQKKIFLGAADAWGSKSPKLG